MTYYFRREGAGYWFAWPEHGVGLAVSHLRDRSEGLQAEVVAHGLELEHEPNGYLSAPVQVNLLGAQTITNVSKRLGARNAGYPWAEFLETVITRTLQEHRTGEPPVDLADIEAPLALPFLLTKLAPAEEISVIFGDGSQGKSLTLLTLGFLCRTGFALPGGISAPHLVEVGYFDWETNATAQRRRLEALARGFESPVPSGIHYFRMTRPAVDEAARMQQEVARRNLGLVLWDSIGYAAHGDIKESSVANEMFAVARSLNTTVLCAHHMSKEAAGREVGPATMFGSAYFRNGARNAWEMRAAQEGTRLRVALFHRKANDDVLEKDPLAWEYRWDRETNTTTIHRYEVEDDMELSGHAGARYVLWNSLRDGAQTVSQLADRTGLEKETVKKALQRGNEFVVATPGAKGRGNEALWDLRPRAS